MEAWNPGWEEPGGNSTCPLILDTNIQRELGCGRGSSRANKRLLFVLGEANTTSKPQVSFCSSPALATAHLFTDMLPCPITTATVLVWPLLTLIFFFRSGSGVILITSINSHLLSLGSTSGYHTDNLIHWSPASPFLMMPWSYDR